MTSLSDLSIPTFNIQNIFSGQNLVNEHFLDEFSKFDSTLNNSDENIQPLINCKITYFIKKYIIVYR
jgi:hypothetical protein